VSSPAKSIIDQCVAQSKANIDLTGVGDAAGIPAANVHKLHVPYQRDDRQRLQFIRPPALVWTISRNVETPAAAGDNRRYVAYYTALAQILHTQLEVQSNDVTDSIFKWEYNIRNYFHMGNLRTSADTDNWKITLSPVQKVDLLDDKLFHIFDDAVAIIPITFKSSEKHSSTGRV